MSPGTPAWANAINSFIDGPSYKPYYGKDTTLGTYSSVGSGLSGRLKPGGPDDFLKLLEQRVNKTATKMPARPRRTTRPTRGRRPARRTKRKVKGRRSVKRKAPIRKKSTKRKKRKVSTSVSLTVGTARERHVDHVHYSDATALYIPINSLGPKLEMLQMVSQSLLLHYMHRVGDYRANVSMVPSGDLASESEASKLMATWSQMTFHFASVAATADVSSFSVYSYYTDGAYAMSTLKQLTADVADGLLIQVKAGRRLSHVTVYRGQTFNSSGQPTEHVAILQDISAGRNSIEFTCKAALKMQNTTLADANGTTDALTCGHDNALNINRNPLDGLVYKFRNAVPKFKMQYLISKTPAQRSVLDGLTDCYSTHQAGITPVDMVAQGDEWKIPPPAPSTIFSNYNGKSGISIAPGSHKSLSLREGYKGPINSFFEKYFPIRLADGNAFEVPPGGSSLMVCFKPKYRNGTQTAVKIETEIDHTYAARVSRAKITPLPMNTRLEDA